jgi:hypothetical protein
MEGGMGRAVLLLLLLRGLIMLGWEERGLPLLRRRGWVNALAARAKSWS